MSTRITRRGGLFYLLFVISSGERSV